MQTQVVKVPEAPIYRKKSLWAKIKENKISYAMVAPFMILFTIFTVIPVIASCVLGFTYFNMLQWPKWIGLLNYQRLFLEDDIFLIAIKNTLIFAFVTGPLSYILCFVFAWFINELPRKLRVFMTVVFYAPSLAGSMMAIWLIVFSSDQVGYLNAFLIQYGFRTEPIYWTTNPQYMMTIAIVVQLWSSLGTSFLSFIAGFKNVDPVYYEAGAIDGIKNRFQELVYITIPGMKGIMLFGAVMQIASSFAVGTLTQELFGFPSTEYAVHTVINHIFDYGHVRYEMGYASAIAFLLTVVMVITKNVITKVLKPD